MILAGLQKNSFIDYPGRISCVLFTTGCNFICPYCHNADLARGRYPVRLDAATVIDFLRSRRGMLEGVVISGGEPTLQQGLVDLCRGIKSMGYPVKLDTNGSRPGIIRQLLSQKLVDYIAMDVKAPLSDYHPFCDDPQIHAKLATSIHVIMQSAITYEFRTTCAAPFIDETAVKCIAETIQGAARYALQSFNGHAVCLDPDFNRRQDPTLLPAAMQRLKALVEAYVGQCIIR